MQQVLNDEEIGLEVVEGTVGTYQTGQMIDDKRSGYVCDKKEERDLVKSYKAYNLVENFGSKNCRDKEVEEIN